jgi:hypothetical protein
VEYGAHTNIAIYEKEVTLMGDHIWKGESKSRKLTSWIWLMYSLYRNEYWILKPVETTTTKVERTKVERRNTENMNQIVL